MPIAALASIIPLLSGGLSIAGGIKGLTGGTPAQNVNLIPPNQLSPYGVPQNVVTGIGNIPTTDYGTTATGANLIERLLSDPSAATAFNAADYARQMGSDTAISAFNQAPQYGQVGANIGTAAAYNLPSWMSNLSNILQGYQAPLAGGAANILQTAFDPQNALFNRTQQQLQEQTRAGLEARGIDTTPYGAGIESKAMSDFDIDWQNYQLQRQATGLGAAGTAYNAASGIGTAAGNLLNAGYTGGEQGATSALQNYLMGVGGGYNAANQFAAFGGLPYSTLSGITGNQIGMLGPQGLQGLAGGTQGLLNNPISQYLNYLQAVNASGANVNAYNTNQLNQANAGFTQSNIYGANLGKGLQGVYGALTGQTPTTGGGVGWNPPTRSGSAGSGSSPLAGQVGSSYPYPQGGYQEGGRPPVGQPARVGEAGTEYFMPDRSWNMQTNFGGPDQPTLWNRNPQSGMGQQGSPASFANYNWLPGTGPQGPQQGPQNFGWQNPFMPQQRRGYQQGGRMGQEGGFVGENGPEYFVPDRPGVIIPHDVLRAFMDRSDLPYSRRGSAPFSDSTSDPGIAQAGQAYSPPSDTSQPPSWLQEFNRKYGLPALGIGGDLLSIINNLARDTTGDLFFPIERRQKSHAMDQDRFDAIKQYLESPEGQKYQQTEQERLKPYQAGGRIGPEGGVVGEGGTEYFLPDQSLPSDWTGPEKNIYQHHWDNLWGPGKLIRPSGEISTVYQIVHEHDGRFYNIPTIWEGKELSEEEAVKRAGEAGWDKWPSYDTPQEADRRYIEDMHPRMDLDTLQYRQTPSGLSGLGRTAGPTVTSTYAPQDVPQPVMHGGETFPTFALRSMAQSFPDLARRAFGSAGELQRTGQYDPEAPLEGALMAMTGSMPFATRGLGAFGGKITIPDFADRQIAARRALERNLTESYPAERPSAQAPTTPTALRNYPALHPVEHALSSSNIFDQGQAFPPHSRSTWDIAKELHTRAQDRLKELGVPEGVLTHKNRTPETDAMLARIIAHETEQAMGRSGHAGTWYTDSVREALDTASTIYPEIATDPHARFGFIAAKAITSQGEKVPANVRLTDQVYSQFRNTGRFPTDVKALKGTYMNENFKKINLLLDNMGSQGAQNFLNEKFTVRELRDMGYNIEGNVDDLVHGSAILGPKIGQGFFQNLTGNYDPVTFDLWWMRTWGRLTGTLSGFPSAVPGALTKFKNELGAKNLPVPRNNRDLSNLADRLVDQHERDFKTNRALYDSGVRVKSALTKAAERVQFNLHGIKEMPGSAGERNWMSSVVNQAREMLNQRGHNLTNADIQALMWYPEKDIYGMLGGKPSEGLNMNYAQAWRDLARRKALGQ